MSNSDYGISASLPGVNVNSAKPNQLAFSTKYAQMKINTQNKAGFFTVLMLITNDPPEPPAGGVNYTVIGQVKHNYTYTPKAELLFNVTTQPVHGTGLDYFLDSGIISQTNPGDLAALYGVADSTYIYFIVNKYFQVGTNPNLLTGTTVQISVHTFVDGVLDT